MNTFKKIILVTTLLMTCLVSAAQISFEISYSTGRNDQARAITQTQDSGYVVVGSTVSYEGNTDVYLMKTDPYGTFLWAKRYGELGMERGHDIIETQDSGLAIIGYGHNNGVYDMLFIKTDKNGDSLYTKFIGESDWDFGNALAQTSDKGYILAGETYDTGGSKAYLVKLDSNGNTEWKKYFGGTLNSKFEDIIIASNGDFVMAGETESFGNDRQAYVVRTDNLGNLIWENNYGNPGVDFAKSITELNSGELAFAGATNTPPYPDLDNWLVKTDNLGVIIQAEINTDYSSTTPFIQNDDWNETILNYNDSLVIAGQRSYNNSEPGNIYIYRFTNALTYAGYQSDFQKFITPNTEIAYDSKHTFDNGVIFACSAEFMDTTSESSIYLIKMDSSMTYPHPYFNSISNQRDYTSISIKSKEIDFAIYPNPSSDYVTLNLEKFENENVTIHIYDSYGKLLLNQLTIETSLEINLSQYNAGIYFVKVNSDKFVTTKRLVVTK